MSTWRNDIEDQNRFIDVVKEDNMMSVDVRVEDAEDKTKWRQMIRCGDH